MLAQPIVGSWTLRQLPLARGRSASQKCCLALCCNSIAKTGGAVKNRAISRTEIFAIVIGALLVAVPMRGQGNVEEIVAQMFDPFCRKTGKEAVLRSQSA